MNPSLADKIKSELTMRQVAEFYLGAPKRNAWVCPFHRDQKPSMTVKDGKFKCWSCNESGDIFDFVSKLNGLDFQGSISLIARDFGYSDTKLSQAEKIACEQRKTARKLERDRLERVVKLERDKIEEFRRLRRVFYRLSQVQWTKWYELYFMFTIKRRLDLLELELDGLADGN